MNKQIKIQILFYFLAFSCLYGQSQDFSDNVEQSSMTIETDVFPAYKTNFDFGSSHIEHSWWKYSRRFGKPLNMRKYYQVSIPREVQGKAVEIKLYSKTLKASDGSTFILAIDDQEIPAENKVEYLNQIRDMIHEFKLWHYKEYYQNILAELNRDSRIESARLETADGQVKKDIAVRLQQIRSQTQLFLTKLQELQ